MKLELKHLAPYLPYGLKVMVEGKEYIMKSCFLTGSGHLAVVTTNKVWKEGFPQRHVIDTKPILRPLSDLTKEEEKELLAIQQNPENEIYGENFGAMQWFLSKHFDVFGLIEEGLAIDIKFKT